MFRCMINFIFKVCPIKDTKKTDYLHSTYCTLQIQSKLTIRTVPVHKRLIKKISKVISERERYMLDAINVKLYIKHTNNEMKM